MKIIQLLRCIHACSNSKQHERHSLSFVTWEYRSQERNVGENLGFGEVKTTTIAKYASCHRQMPSVVVVDLLRLPSDAVCRCILGTRKSNPSRLQVYFSADRSMLITHTKPVRRQGISRAIERWTNNLGHIQTRNHPLETSFHHRHRRIQKYLAKSKIQNACLASSSRDDHGTNDAGWRTGMVARCTQTVPPLESQSLSLLWRIGVLPD